MRQIALFALLLASATPAFGWGNHGHVTVNRAAAKGLAEQADVPEFLRTAVERLAYLGPEPDRWRIRDLACLNRGAAPDHFIDLEWAKGIDPLAPPPNRHEYGRIVARNLGKAPDTVGYAPYRVVELCETIEASMASLALITGEDEVAAQQRSQARENVLYCAGLLGHYVADLSNPHHCTIHYNGWKGDNPNKFPTDQGTHWRFESAFVERVKADLDVTVATAARSDLNYMREVWALVVESNKLTTPLYELDKAGAFAEGNEKKELGVKGRVFAQERMARSATLLRDMWVTACVRGKRRGRSEALQANIKQAFTDAGLDLRVSVNLERLVKVWGEISSAKDGERAREIVAGFDDVATAEFNLRTLY